MESQCNPQKMQMILVLPGLTKAQDNLAPKNTYSRGSKTKHHSNMEHFDVLI